MPKVPMERLDQLFDTASHGVYDMHSMMKSGDIKRSDIASATPVPKDVLRPLVDVRRWLPAAAEELDISPDIRDYVIVPIEIIRSDIPNNNGIGFPAEELVRFNTDYGRLAYQTWIGKGTYKEHANNRVPRLARGVIMDVAIVKATEFTGNFTRLIHLASFDRNKDNALVEDIVSRRRTGYSMGSSCRDYSCSICGTLMGDEGQCTHIKTMTAMDRARSLRVLNGKLAFAQTRWVTGVEVSSVEVPAAKFAVNPDVLATPRRNIRTYL